MQMSGYESEKSEIDQDIFNEDTFELPSIGKTLEQQSMQSEPVSKKRTPISLHSRPIRKKKVST